MIFETMSISKNLTGAYLTTHSPVQANRAYPVLPPLMKSKPVYKIDKAYSPSTTIPTNAFKPPELKKLNGVQPYFIEMYNKNKRQKFNTVHHTVGEHSSAIDSNQSKHHNDHSNNVDKPLLPMVPLKSKSDFDLLDGFDVGTNLLVDELWRSRTFIVGIDICLTNVCETNPNTIYTLLPKRRLHYVKELTHKQNTGMKQAELLATLPHSAELKTHSRLRANKRGPSFYSHFGQEGKVEQYYVDCIVRRTGRAPHNPISSSYSRSKDRKYTGSRKVPSLEFKENDSSNLSANQDAQSRLTAHSGPHPSRADTYCTNKTAAVPVDPSSLETNCRPSRIVDTNMSIDIAVQDESGQVHKLNIDESDAELRRGSVVARQEKDRHESEMVAEEIRQTAETRRKELAELLDEHDQLVHEIDRMASKQTTSSEQTKAN